MAPEIKALIIIIIGLIFCFAGYKLQKFLITMIWFIIGFRLVAYVGPKFIDGDSILLVAEIVAGFLLASVGFKLEKLALFVTVAYLTYITIGPFIKGFEPNLTLLIHGVVSLLAGGLAVFLIKPIISIVTALAGAGVVYQYLPMIIQLNTQVCLIIAIVIALMGIIVQFKTN